ncbi:MAG: hypothetical protein EP341_00660 [Sphingomonadales bacterium]|nr:MAG: hypothetical protein EP341_00660 [Sphingomonadales bacterium]
MFDIRAAALSMFLVVVSWPAAASLDLVQSYVPEAELAGEARMRVLIWNVFDAALYAPEGEYDPDAPFALSLSYLRDFTSDQIVTRSLHEMARQGPLDPQLREQWRVELAGIIPNVGPGVTIVGVRDSQGHAHFFLGREWLGTVADPDFSQRFFNIWLGPETSSPAFQRAMLGGQDL